MKPLVKKIAFVTLIYLLLVNNVLIAQNPSQIDVLTTEQGLIFRDVTSITQDHNDAMWFGTDLGLVRYDGYHFKVYNSDKSNPFYIEKEFITGELVFDETTNELWYMANENLFKIQLTTDEVIAFGKTDNLKGNVLRLLKDLENNIWVITDDFLTARHGQAKQYLQKLVNGTFDVKYAIPRNKHPYSRLISDKNGDLLWSTPLESLKFDTKGNLLKTFNFSTFQWHGNELQFTVSFYDSQNTHYYFPQKERGVFSLNETDLSSKRVFDIVHQFYYGIEDYQKHLWFASNKELIRMSPDGKFTDYTAQLQARFEYTKINDLFIDVNKLLWVATDNGLFKIRIGEELFTPLFKSNSEGWGHTMRGIFEDANGTIFAKCESKNKLIYKTITGKIDTLTIQLDPLSLEGLQYTANFYVLDGKKQNVFTLGENLLKINLKNGATKSYEEFRPNVTFKEHNPLIKLKDGRLLFGQSLSRLVLFDPDTETSEPVFKDFNNETDIADFTYFKESVSDSMFWIGTRNDGLLKVHLSGRIETQYTTNSQPNISRNFVLVIEEEPNGSLWVGTYGGGLNFISEDGQTAKVYTKYQGLPDENIVGILTDAQNNLWISTYNGLSHFDKKSEIFQNFYTEDGLSHFEFNYTSFFKDSQDNFYFGGMNGLNQFKPTEVLKYSEPPTLRLLGIAGYNSKDRKGFSTDYSQTEFTSLEVSPYDQYFEINWTMPSYFQNQKHTYSTKLEGFEDRWFYRGNVASLRYNQLPAGNYVLKIKGKDSRGNESAAMLSIPIHVGQIFYKKLWFIMLVMLVMVGFMYAIFRYRFQQALAMERLRTKISSDLHDDVGSLLSGLAMQTELMEMNASEADKFKLQKIASISRNAISQMRDLVWSIDSRRETVKDLIERMHELAEELLLPKNISFQIDSSSVRHPNRKLSAQTKQNLFMIYKEAITNILRHSDATRLAASIINQPNGCDIVIKDNGSLKKSYKSTGFGLANMALRAEKLKGKIHFKKESGFTVHLHLPFHL
ncbi:sensor histidine kinase [Gelidibacter salicanalis]|uniref:Two-component system sensor with a ligand-binding domain protein n=1 Tax=Gelidibacter salicanalis TaxID=291193 RepID=A0A934KP46_9FLAO|nr:sensor histidine kinase [Gelidibacter salicanalis]MBJ7882906.1 two-component system sensor with a ligand-binding domain protein [Gelidibacter salicanalis]